MPLPIIVDATAGSADIASQAFTRFLCQTLDESGVAYDYLQDCPVALSRAQPDDADDITGELDRQSGHDVGSRLHRALLLAYVAAAGLTPLQPTRSGEPRHETDPTPAAPSRPQWTAPDLRARSVAYFRAFRRPLRLRQPEPFAAIHWSAPRPMRMMEVSNLYWFPDLAALRLPYGARSDSAAFLRLCRTVAHQAAHILAAPEACRADLLSLLGLPASRVTVVRPIPCTIEVQAGRAETDLAQALQARLGLEWGQYYIFPEPVGLLSNFARLQQAIFASGISRPVIATAGRAGPHWHEGDAMPSAQVQWRHWCDPASRIDKRLTFIEGMPTS